MVRGGCGGYGRNGVSGNHLSKGGGWNTVLSKKDARREKMFLNREYRLRNATTFFISNLPDGCNRESLWKAFSFVDNLEDVFVPWKKDRAGNKFGFIKISFVRDVDSCIDRLKEVVIEGSKIGVNLAKYGRDGSKLVLQNHGEKPSGSKASVFSRLSPEILPSNPLPGLAGSKSDAQFGKRTYSSVVNSDPSESSRSIIDLPPMNSKTKKDWEFRSLIGEVKDIDILNNLSSLLSGVMEDSFDLKYIGGLKVMLCFKSQEEAEVFRCQMVEVWEKWFSRVYAWEGLPPLFDRVAWIKVLGVPASLWDRHVMNKIGERCGRLLVKSDADASDGNMSEDRMAVLVQSGKRISEEFKLCWKDHIIRVWVEEISGQWVPDFLNSSDSETVISSPGISSEFVSSPVGSLKSPEVVKTPVTEGIPLNNCMEDSHDVCMENEKDSLVPTKSAHGQEVEREDVGLPTFCMGINKDLSVPNTTVHAQKEGVGNMDLPTFCNNEEREEVGPGLSIGLEADYVGPGSAEFGPRYVTCRPNRGNNPKKKAHPLVIPDLNQEADISNNSDPFNIEEIFRMEKEGIRDSEPISRCRVNGGSSAEVMEEEHASLNFEKETSSTVDLGIRLGIGVEGFKNNMRKLVRGETETTRNQ
ncbi:putative RNA recognition motif domain, nucleotide-binding alpha-beta plait domain superfamily [Helianthus debilis subsp. tardiflorus]